ncbi:hypothetical protein RvY_00003 [Ramazzottius varieornatus]|uniref:Uncharacterized protein n=1 Tax=Ramazzottius varieornatus TaxID=947166 RepID=A0A1D1UFD7_RAMVA|nr:hypothetical protein RvY_00003 [Ramazzottius varieornatus]
MLDKAKLVLLNKGGRPSIRSAEDGWKVFCKVASTMSCRKRPRSAKANVVVLLSSGADNVFSSVDDTSSKL